MKRYLFLISLAILLSSAARSQSHLRDTSIRKTNWLEYFKHNADFSIDSTSDFIDSNWGKYFVLSSDTAHEDPIPGGYPALDNIQYGDIDGDGHEEAAMIFYSGGTAGALSYAVFRQNGKGPSLIEWRGGYKLGCGMRNGTLLIYQPEYTGGWEPNCCPSSMWTYSYRLKDNTLVLTDSLKAGLVDMASSAVERFYQMLSSSEYTAAYGMLSEKYKAAHPFERWQDGFASTISSDATVDTMRTSDSTVHIKLKATTSTKNGANIENLFEGYWKVHWYPDMGWLLEEPKIRKVKK